MKPEAVVTPLQMGVPFGRRSPHVRGPYSMPNHMERDRSWHDERLPLVDERIRKRLGELSRRLGEADWLDGAFSAGDLMMVSVLQRIRSSGILDEYPNLSAYVARGEARPAHQRAFADQLAVFKAASSR